MKQLIQWSNNMKWLKKLFKRSSQPTLRDKLVEMYGEEAGEAYDKTHMGIPIGGILKTTIYVCMLEDAKKALEAEL